MMLLADPGCECLRSSLLFTRRYVLGDRLGSELAKKGANKTLSGRDL